MRLIYRGTISQDFPDLGETKEALVGPASDGVCYTVLMDDSPVFIVGCLPFWPGTVTVWMHVKKNVELPAMQTTRVCKKLLDTELAEFNRVQCFIDPSSEMNCRFAEAIGFVYESTMVGGSPYGGDFLVYRRG